MLGRRKPRARSGPDIAVTWNRDKILVLLAGGTLILGLLGVGLALALVDLVRGSGDSASADRTAVPAVGRDGRAAAAAAAVDSAGLVSTRDELAARAMPQVPQSASRPSAISLQDPGPPIVLPPATGLGPAGVPTGFPRTPQGALAQLAALDAAALSSGSVAGARAVIAGWALPGGPTTTSWSGVRAIAGLLEAAGVAGGTGQLAVVATPSMGLIKGTDGPDFVIPCIDFAIDVTVNTTARAAIADCQRMVWSGERWLIGPGPEPADPPSVWPGSELSITVGYRDLRRG